MQPLNVRETATRDSGDLWHRGGFPESFLATDEASSFEWRFDFIRTYLERDMPALGPRIPGETLRRFWTMLAHSQGQSFNASRLAGSLGLTGATVGRYLGLMVDLLLVRRLVSWRSSPCAMGLSWPRCTSPATASRRVARSDTRPCWQGSLPSRQRRGSRDRPARRATVLRVLRAYSIPLPEYRAGSSRCHPCGDGGFQLPVES